MNTNTSSGNEEINADDLAKHMLGEAYNPDLKPEPEPLPNFPPGVNDSEAIDADRPRCDATDPSGLHLWLARRIGIGELDHMFRRQGLLVRIIPGAIEPINAKQLRAEIDYTFRSYKHVKDSGTMDINFPLVPAENAAGAVHRLRNAREICGITSIPLFRGDGELIDKPGYDDVTKMLYQPAEGLKVHVPEEPSRQALFEAATLIKYPISQFPFETEADRWNWIGCAFTPLLRYLAPGPYKMAVVEAHQPGSGKGFLTGMLRMVHGGVLRGSLPEGEAEIKKTITTALLGAEGIIVFDNVKGTIKSPSIEALLTAETWSDRLLHKNVDATIPNDRLWMVTGNNAKFGGDMARRILKIRLDAGPSPEKRTGFQIDNPIKWMADHRGEYLSALMTVIRSWLYAGAQMPQATSSDSYALWRQMVSGILQHAGLGEEFDSASTQLALSEEDEEWETFLYAIRDKFGSSSWTSRELAEALGTTSDLEAVLPSALAHRWTGFANASFKTSLSKFLDTRDRRWYRDVMMWKSEKQTRGAYRWTIEAQRK
jgi:hypothetical protein